MNQNERTERVLDRPVSSLRGVGETRAAALTKLGIRTVEDLLRCWPRAYQNRGDVRTVAEIRERLGQGINDPCAAILTIAAEPEVRMIRRGMVLLKVRAFDETGSVGITYFNQPYRKDQFKVGETFRFFGRFGLDRRTVTAASPIAEPYDEARPLPDLVPVYPLTSGLTQRLMAGLVEEALRLAGQELTEFMPQGALAELHLPTYGYTVSEIHRPQSLASLDSARRRLVFDELYLMFLALNRNSVGQKRANTIQLNDTDLTPFWQAMPFEPTGAQRRSVGEILADMSGPSLMNRILTGDVGSGKTAVAEAAAYAAVKNGYRAVIMAPTEILATQHAAGFDEVLGKLGVRCALLTGSTKKSSRQKILEGLVGDGEIDVVIGTHALLTEDVVIDRLGLCVIDEQHRFGVTQRAALFEKAADVHCLVMSATPIPRTLTLAAYGSIDVSRLDELPAGRQKIDSFIVDESYRARLNAFIAKQAAEGHQTYVVCPAVEENEKNKEETDPEEVASFTLIGEMPGDSALPLKAATRHAAELAEALPDLRIGFVHGKLKSAEKEKVMSEFAAGNLDVLVSTTVIEVGVNVPNATLMIVENAERFGLSQLHQLRGRVGRGQAKSYFILVTDSERQEVTDRLNAVKRTTDGFEIAEYDLEMRGPGDFFHESGVIRQSGQMELKLASACRDKTLIGRAAAWAKKAIADDPTLMKPENRETARHLAAVMTSADKINN